ncbi:protein O-mannosyltransferase 1 isoform X2 [Daktulosphaira vitifoliae]|uniref:protein O-mannosyltransferase 1 isoform X2 n=1 Tax=Daktulosphaira vitifoliae TaxID=58002 RepID=UPI0021A9CF1F|nr:protein O-mannosyltransferase 1 isoform X2 [Daktulosphaira vitifoliae]
MTCQPKLLDYQNSKAEKNDLNIKRLSDNEQKDLIIKQQIDDELFSKIKYNDKYKQIICKEKSNDEQKQDIFNNFKISIEINILAVVLFLSAVSSRFFKLNQPRNVVFDELHHGKYVSLYMKRTFFFDTHPPLGKQLISAAAYFCNYEGDYKFERIGSEFSENVPLFGLRFVPALCGSLIIPVAYQLMLELGCRHWCAALAAFLLLCENTLLTQSRFILMESMLIFFTLCGLLFVLKYKRSNMKSSTALLFLACASIFLTAATCVKYVGLFSWFLSFWIICRDYWVNHLSDKRLSDFTVAACAILRVLITITISVMVYVSVFFVHLMILNKAGPHDSVMTSAFQASLEGGLASITKGQPLNVAHGSQITLRHTHGRTCWLHSHTHVYPIKYADKRGSSHQQQVTCYTFKDVNNWWIVKRPGKNSLAVENTKEPDGIQHGDFIQLVHGMTSRALNSHDVAAPVSPQNQEVSCYIDYNVSMPAQNLWKVEILNREQFGNTWQAINSRVMLIHFNTSQALKFSGRQLPDWGFNQHEIVTDKVLHQDDTVWNVEEHRYTKSENEKDRERELVNAEMIPTKGTKLSLWERFWELQYKIIFSSPATQNIHSHMYSSDPLEWPLMVRGVAYWLSENDNGQIHLLGNIVIWYSSTLCVLFYSFFFIFYLLRQRRKIYDLSEDEWEQFKYIGEVLMVGYIMHYLPYFFMDRTLFLHHYLPALVFKILLCAAFMQHLANIVRSNMTLRFAFHLSLCMWILCVMYVFKKFIVFSYGTSPLTAKDVFKLRWKETWDFIVHKP